MAVKPKRRRGNRWRRYEAEKKALAARGLSNVEYERAVQQLAKRCRL